MGLRVDGGPMPERSLDFNLENGVVAAAREGKKQILTNLSMEPVAG